MAERMGLKGGRYRPLTSQEMESIHQTGLRVFQEVGIEVNHDPARDLFYIWFGKVGAKAAQTVTVVPGVHADLDASGKLIGLEVLDATEVLGRKVQFEVALPPSEPIEVSGD